jgi:beta-lactamase regulating signal transducer with metallopeptidase domain
MVLTRTAASLSTTGISSSTVTGFSNGHDDSATPVVPGYMIAVVTVAVVVLIAIVIYCLYSRQKRKAKKTKNLENRKEQPQGEFHLNHRRLMLNIWLESFMQ